MTEHDAGTADAWAVKVRRNDAVWVLGDLAFGNPTRTLALIRWSVPMLWWLYRRASSRQRTTVRRACQ